MSSRGGASPRSILFHARHAGQDDGLAESVLIVAERDEFQYLFICLRLLDIQPQLPEMMRAVGPASREILR